jgi:hypothetical protein
MNQDDLASFLAVTLAQTAKTQARLDVTLELLGGLAGITPAELAKRVAEAETLRKGEAAQQVIQVQQELAAKGSS